MTTQEEYKSLTQCNSYNQFFKHWNMHHGCQSISRCAFINLSVAILKKYHQTVIQICFLEKFSEKNRYSLHDITVPLVIFRVLNACSPSFQGQPRIKAYFILEWSNLHSINKTNLSWHYLGPRSHGNTLSYSSKYMDHCHWFVSLNNLGEVNHDFENLFLLPYAGLK